MDDAMIDLMAGDAQLQRRLAAFADARLSPDQASMRRIRARVLATAHREAALARADASLTVLPAGSRRVTGTAARPSTRSGRLPVGPLRRMGASLLAATLVLSAFVGTAAAARPGGPLYETRLWLETLTLPADPSSRAVAELGRLSDRLAEADDAAAHGDPAAASAALAAYEAIAAEASAYTADAHDAVAIAAMEAGLAHNVLVLMALADRLPDQAVPAIDAAIDHAILRSDAAIDTVTGAGSEDSGGGNGTGGGASGGGGTGGGASDDGGNGPQASTPAVDATSSDAPKPSKPPAAKPTNAPTPEPVVEPTKAPKPDRTPPGDGPPTGPPGGGDQGDQGGPGGDQGDGDQGGH